MARVRSPSPEAEPEALHTALAPRPRAAGGTRKRKVAPPPASTARPHVVQVVLLSGIAICVFVALALGSWSPHDPSFSVAGDGDVHNLGGPVGAYVADAAYQTAGWAAWVVVLLAGRMALRLAGRPGAGWLTTLLAGFGTWMAATALQLLLAKPGQSFPPGGLVGLGTAALLLRYLGAAGAGIVVVVGIVGSATLLFRIDWQPLAARAVDRVQVATPAAARAVGAAGAGVVRVGVRASSSVAGAVKERWVARRLQAAEEEEELAEDEEVDPEPELPEEELARPDRSVWSARPAPPPRLLPAPVDRPTQTQVGRRALVEVELERTSAVPTMSTRAPAPPPVQSADVRTAAANARPTEPRGTVAAPRAAPIADDFDEAVDLQPGLPDLASNLVDGPARRNTSPLGRPVALDDDYDIPSAAGFLPPRELAEAPVSPGTPVTPVSPVATPILLPPPAEPARRPLPIIEDEGVRRPEPRRRGRIEIAPGNLQSGGVVDDGSAVRDDPGTPFQLPPLSLLDDHPAIVAGTDESRLHDLARKLTGKLQDFGVEGRVSAIRPGPVITMFEYEPAPGIKISKIAALADDIAMALKALGVRIVAPIPGRGVVGVEVPNESRQTVWARDVFAAPEFREGRNSLPVVLGKDTEGRPYVTDLARTPHLLVGGTTGSGKSVGINAMLISMLLTRTPEELRLILIDPKMLEFELYKDIPHLLHPVVTEAKLASRVLAWACEEMDHRYRLLGDWKVRNIESFNQKVEVESADWTPEKAKSYYPDWPEGQLVPLPKKLPYVVVVIDELADLMMVASKDVEMSIARLAQKARASGIHLIVATQRPSADVITGLIRSNMPSRLAYQVRTKTESRIILDQNGADALLGKGDLLFLPPGVSGLTRIHGPFLSDEEVRRVADFLRAQGAPNYAPAIRVDEEGDGEDDELEQLDEEMGAFYNEVVDLAIEKGQISTSMIQRHLKIGYNRACSLMELLEKQGVVGPADGAKPRKVLIRD